jgi:SAM-dependent methyltransferase
MQREFIGEKGMKTGGTTAPNMEFTGERIVPGKTEESLFREHEERYIFAGEYVSGKDVLDVACGTGVGTSFLRGAGARSAWGLDIDPGAIAYAKERYPECKFAQSDATDLCLPDGSIDVVVCFETLEHIKDQRKFLMECQRVLRPGGTFICSTPNKPVYRWQGANPFHVRELTVHEFVELISMHLDGVRVFSQAEHMYPFFLLRLLASRALDSLRLKATIKSIVGWKESLTEMRGEFSGRDSSVIHKIRPYRKLWFRRPTYLIAAGRKMPGTAGSNG